ncbi:hypothetical protein [Elioraea sp.]|uniref:DUF7453 family protein n=1 Tax=Elioraea sp. TaxID=2185103 RepID=UPI0025BB6959|nr:hypothetical protein [Elioraea sp.]
MVAAPSPAIAARIEFSIISPLGGAQTEVSAPSINGGVVTYLSTAAGDLPPFPPPMPIYTRVMAAEAATGASQLVAQAGVTPMPAGGGAPFLGFLGVPSVDGGRVAFVGTGQMPDGSERTGIYIATPVFGGAGYTVAALADTATPAPRGSGTFTQFNPPFMADGEVVFSGLDGAGNEGIYRARVPTSGNPPDVTLVANMNTPVPGNTGTFYGLSTYPTISNGVVAFNGASTAPGPTNQGIFVADASGIIAVRADRTSFGPPGSDTSYGFSPTISAGNLAFSARTAPAFGGPYTGQLYYVPAAGGGVEINGPLPDMWPALDLGLLAYGGQAGSPDPAIYTTLGQPAGVPVAVPVKLVGLGDLLGETGLAYYGYSPFLPDGYLGPIFHQGVDYESNAVVFRALVGPPGWDPTSGPPDVPINQAIIVARVIPEPSGGALVLTMLALFAPAAAFGRRQVLHQRTRGPTNVV